ncbi:MAG: TatD family hydrolase [Clostridiales bacterium]|jgi:TatD DNase family protein|nr:TatD family hydrolase [Clostridiales bacterium]
MDSWPEKLKIADSHAHLDMEDFSQDREDVVRRAWEGGVHGLLCPAEMTTPQSLPTVLGLSERYPWVAAAAGVHPHQAKELRLKNFKRLFSV